MADIFSTNPYGLTVQKPTLMQSFYGSADAMGNLLNKGYQNQQEAAKAQYAKSTLDDSIAATNSKNQANALYYPQQQALITQNDAAKIQETMARTGLTYAQAREALANAGLINTQQQVMANPFKPTANMIDYYSSLPVDDRKRMALGAILDDSGYGGGTMFPSMGTGSAGMPGAKGAPGKSAINPMTGALPGLGGSGWVRDTRFGPTRGGGGGTYTDPSTGQRISTDTTANSTQDQATVAAVQRVQPLLNDIADKQSQFLTIGGKGKLYKARIGNLFGGDSKLPYDYAGAQAEMKQSAEGLIKTYGLKVTDQATTMMLDAVKPVWGESPHWYKQRLMDTLNTIKQNQAEAQGRMDTGMQVGQAAPVQAQLGYFRRNAVSDPSVWGMQSQAQNAPAPTPQPVPQQQQGVQIPQFITPDEFRAWFKLQPLAMQAQIAAQLPKKGQ